MNWFFVDTKNKWCYREDLSINLSCKVYIEGSFNYEGVPEFWVWINSDTTKDPKRINRNCLTLIQAKNLAELAYQIVDKA